MKKVIFNMLPFFVGNVPLDMLRFMPKVYFWMMAITFFTGQIFYPEEASAMSSQEFVETIVHLSQQFIDDVIFLSLLLSIANSFGLLLTKTQDFWSVKLPTKFYEFDFAKWKMEIENVSK